MPLISQQPALEQEKNWAQPGGTHVHLKVAQHVMVKTIIWL